MFINGTGTKTKDKSGYGQKLLDSEETDVLKVVGTDKTVVTDDCDVQSPCNILKATQPLVAKPLSGR